MSEDRHTIECNLIVTNSDGKKTAYATIGLGEMKLEDVLNTEKALLETFLGLLAKR